MVAAREENGVVASRVVQELRFFSQLLLIRFAPFFHALATEPWITAADALGVLRRKWRRFAKKNISYVGRIDGPSELRQTQVATAFLGICAAIILVLKVTNENAKTYSDEVAWIAAGLLAASLVLTGTGDHDLQHRSAPGLAHWFFITGAGALLASMLFAIMQL